MVENPKNYADVEASYYRVLNRDLIECTLCPHACRIPENASGICRVRKNSEGTLIALNYGQVSVKALDPIEKKPLYHFYPGSTVYSLGTFGCNLHCSFCQNWTISQGDPSMTYLSPDDAVNEALHYRDNHSCIGIAYTYSEPVVWFEYVRDTAQTAHRSGLKNILVTNGFIQSDPLASLIPEIDAVNIDLKGFTDGFYGEICKGKLGPVLETIAFVHGKCHLELTILLIPGKNDSDSELELLTDWIASIDKEIPIHFSRYYPQYKMNLPPTPLASLEAAYTIARKKLDYVYVGNVPGHNAVHTFCPECKTKLIHREGLDQRNFMKEIRSCPHCGRMIRMVAE